MDIQFSSVNSYSSGKYNQPLSGKKAPKNVIFKIIIFNSNIYLKFLLVTNPFL